MVILFIVIGGEVLKCYTMRFCDALNAVDFIRMWEIGLVEIMFEGTLGGVALKVYRHVQDKARGLRQDRLDKKVF